MQSDSFTCDLKKSGKAFDHYWEHTVGSGHATLALRADWQHQLRRCHRELGFRHVRFHGILSDDMGTLVCQNREFVYSFFNANSICDFLLSIGMRPFVELSFMPSALAAGGDTVFHYGGRINPPKKIEDWTELVERLAQNWVDRYGIAEVSRWFFEVWNEPNLKSFWTGSQSDYFKFYENSAKALKRIHPSLQVGGPATADNAWVPEFLGFCERRSVPVDFVSTHHYPTDSFGKPGDDTMTQLAASHRHALREEAHRVRRQAKGKPVYYTEWCTSSNPFDDLHDSSYAPAFIVKTVMEGRGLVEGYSYWTFSDLFEENYFSSVPFHGGFGLMTIHGIPKPAYRGFEFLHRMGDEILDVEGSHPTVDVWATREQGIVHLLVTNSALPRHRLEPETVRVALKGLSGVREASIERIDSDNANPRRAWEDLGSPVDLSPEAVKTLEIASKPRVSPLPLVSDQDGVSLEIKMPRHGTAHVTLELG